MGKIQSAKTQSSLVRMPVPAAILLAGSRPATSRGQAGAVVK
jgi:hypothetical protein